MNADFDSLTERVLGAVLEVSNTLGAGFLEKIYERALLKELELRGLRAIAQKPVAVAYKGHAVGEYFADIVVEDAVLIELKCVDRFASEHRAVPELSAGLRSAGLSSCEFSKAQSGVEANRVQVFRVG